ncbi:MAG: alpha amylase C-terminal domain-containing protein, partial [Weeksellaceae bacterium]|nr:alpha amylase C-terminal domain-containing protein [Weeksellaceae bacterium]
DYRIGVDEQTDWKVILNSDEGKYSGSGVEAVISQKLDEGWNNRKNSIIIRLPPLSGVVLKQSKLIKKSKIADFLKRKK